jgi:hypothetical protein
MTSRLSISRGIIISILSISMLQGCASRGGYQGDQDSFKSSFMKGLSRGSGGHQTVWDPPEWMGYGARIPNMEGDWERFCKEEPARCG